MFEKVPEKLLNRWNRRGKNSGLPVEKKSVAQTSLEALIKIFPGVDEFAEEKFKELSAESQKSIIFKLGEKISAMGPREKISDLLDALLDVFGEMEEMTGSTSDLERKQKYFDEQLKLREEIEDFLEDGLK